ncbi:hypothetical protein OIU85_019172 [Salix viminalis]|uniref:Uncharacterized protein n=1 Tax=Salix viminalis TaxID=40686 RepID=A0A9Q0UVZ4_SALVM|nr:hypothetical protein OIU85_019172 [Salix viminalis]
MFLICGICSESAFGTTLGVIAQSSTEKQLSCPVDVASLHADHTQLSFHHHFQDKQVFFVFVVVISFAQIENSGSRVSYVCLGGDIGRVGSFAAEGIRATRGLKGQLQNVNESNSCSPRCWENESE